jgi:ribosome-associated heat shock protein Hsp15
MSEKLRIDKYLWAIRVFKTRTLAADACNEGKVKCNGLNVKPAKIVPVGEQYDIKTPARRWTIKVTGLLHNRVAYEEAIKYYSDHTSEEDLNANNRLSASFFTGKRQSKTGRPTKKQRRDLEDFMGDDPGAIN